MFLADAVAGYVETLGERDFDVPFIALLHSLGYTDVHLTHGPLEFGKDFIARHVEDGVEYQYCFQSKAGDLNVKAWRDVRTQIDSMRYGTVVHPAFDADLPRRLVLVTTGRLNGFALVEFQDYNTHEAKKGEPPAELWDFDVLVPQLTDVLITGVPVRQRARTIELWGRLGSGEGTWAELRQYSRPWFATGLSEKERWEHTLTGAMLAQQAMLAAREDLAASLTFLLIRREWENPPSGGTDPGGSPLSVARLLFMAHAQGLWETVKHSEPSDEPGTESLDLIVTHPARTSRRNETLSLLGLWLLGTDASEAAAIADYLESTIERDLAASHLISDDYATSLLVTCVFLGATHRDATLRTLLRGAAVWLFDRTEEGHGLPPVGSSADEVVARLLGVPYEHIPQNADRSSYAIAVITDLAWIFKYEDLYADLCNDIWALDIIPKLVLPTSATQASFIARIEYSRDGSAPAAHHGAVGDDIPAFVAGALFDCLAGWTTHRDRHLPAILAAIIARATAPAS